MSDIFGISISALNTAQLGLATTEHNIANANTPGYNRQQVIAQARPAQLTGSGYLGQGADVGNIKRIYDQFLSNQVTQQQGQAAQLNSYFSQISQINNMLADPNAGLSPALQAFFNSVNALSSSPESMPARQAMLNSANSLVGRFQSLNQQLSDLNTAINGQITTSITTINSYSSQIATLNQNIILAQAASGGKPPNDLLDQRDQLVTQLNQEVNANVIKQGDGSYTITVGTGQLLVVGNYSYNLSAVQSNSDPSKLEVASGSGNSITALPQGSLSGGNLGGLLAFRSQTLDQTQNMLGLVAMGLAGTFNQQHALGQDLNGAMANTTNSFFVDVPPVVNKNLRNAGTATVTATVADYSKLTGSDYSLSYSAAGYTLTRLSDNTTLFSNQATLPTTPVDGLNLSAAGAPAAGDSFIIRPTVNGALSMAVSITNPSKIAAAAPVLANAPASSNQGTGVISSGSIDTAIGLNTLTAATAPAVPITFSVTPATFTVDGTAVTVNTDVTVAGTGTGAGTLAAAIKAGLTAAGLTAYGVSAAPGGGLQIYHTGSSTPVAITAANAAATANGIVNGAGATGPTFTTATVTPAITLTYASATNTLSGFPANMPVAVTNNGVTTTYAAGAPVTYASGATISFGGVSFTLTGTPLNNDKFTVSQNINAPTDNRNALLLANLQAKNTLLGGTTTYQGVYGQLVSQVGNKTRELDVTSKAQTALVNQSIQAQQSVSGVNLDEEAANLLRYQRAYQAAGKAMQIASTLFDTLIAIGR